MKKKHVLNDSKVSTGAIRAAKIDNDFLVKLGGSSDGELLAIMRDKHPPDISNVG